MVGLEKREWMTGRDREVWRRGREARDRSWPPSREVGSGGGRGAGAAEVQPAGEPGEMSPLKAFLARDSFSVVKTSCGSGRRVEGGTPAAGRDLHVSAAPGAAEPSDWNPALPLLGRDGRRQASRRLSAETWHPSTESLTSRARGRDRGH